MSKYFFFLPLLSTVFFACGPRYLVDETIEIPESKWVYKDSLRFEAEIPDTAMVYDLWLTLDHSPEFAWQNLYIRIHTLFPDGKRLSAPLSLELADQGGIWQGDCNSKRCRFRVPIQEGAWFQLPGVYTFTFEQYMRESPVTGIQRFRFQIAETGKSRQ
jgi:gliding motility-associated lipoprotein GldH